MQKFPKAIIHEVYQLHNGVPQFTVEPTDHVAGEPRFRCNLVCPAVTVHSHSFPETAFTADARTKRSAEHAASALALDALRRAGVMRASTFPSPQPAFGPPVVTRDEATHLNQRLVVLSAQLEAQQLERRQRALSLTQEPVEEVDVDALTLDEAREKLKSAMAERKELALQLSLEASKRKFAIDVLQGQQTTPPA